MKLENTALPQEITDVCKTLSGKGFEAYLVGGCVRGLLMGQKPRDWDIATNAKPEEIQELFSDTFYENDFGTVGVVCEHPSDETLKVIEITPYRKEGKYEDGRRPSSVSFDATLEDDLGRRDFTINAIAWDPYNGHSKGHENSKGHSKGHLFDPYKGQQDIKDKILKTVGGAEDRFKEDHLRMLRAVRITTELDFSMDSGVEKEIVLHAKHIESVSRERIRDEFSKIIMSKSPMQGVQILHKLGLLQYIAPDLERGINVEQNGDHIYDVWEHNLRAVQHSADRDWPLHIRLAALLHDVSKPETRRWSEEKKDWTFYGHDVVGGRVSREILKQLKYPKDMVETVSKLVRYHLFFSDIDKITLSAVRRLVRNVGADNVWDLMKVRACDRIGMGRPKEQPYRLRKYESMIEEAMRAPVSVGMLKINGDEIMKRFHEKPGVRIGYILHALLEEVLDDPAKNDRAFLVKRAGDLIKLPDDELKKLGEAGKEKQGEKEQAELAKIRRKYGVK